MLRFGVARLLILGLVGLALGCGGARDGGRPLWRIRASRRRRLRSMSSVRSRRGVSMMAASSSHSGPSGGARIFPEQRYVPADAASNSWLVSSDVTHVDDDAGTDHRAAAGRWADGVWFPRRGRRTSCCRSLRFVPAVTSGGWLRSSELSFSVAPPDLAPEFSATLGDQRFNTRGETTELTLPAAEGGDGALSYMLLPVVARPQLRRAAAAAGRHAQPRRHLPDGLPGGRRRRRTSMSCAS